MNAESYRGAAVEHIPIATELYEGTHYVLANYVAGLAVECILRAYRIRLKPEFDARHDLRELFKQSGLGGLFPPARHAEYTSYVTVVAAQRSNSHRYRSEKSLRGFLKGARMHRTVRKGDYLKELTRRMVQAATELVNVGDRLWPQSSKRT